MPQPQRRSLRARASLTACIGAATVTTLALAPSVLAVHHAAPTCHGERATIVGTPGNDAGRTELVGHRGHDVIVGRGGNDIIDGRGGNDVICAGAGRDYVAGGSGRDVIRGGARHDVLFGEGGRDMLKGDGGNDGLDGGAGYDHCDGGGGDDLAVEPPSCNRISSAVRIPPRP